MPVGDGQTGEVETTRAEERDQRDHDGGGFCSLRRGCSPDYNCGMPGTRQAVGASGRFIQEQAAPGTLRLLPPDGRSGDGEH